MTTYTPKPLEAAYGDGELDALMRLKVYSDGTDWYVAESLDDLARCIEEHNGHTYEEMVGEPLEEAFETIDLDQAFRMHFPDSDIDEAVRESPISAVRYLSGGDGHPVMEATYGAWVAHRGRGFLASTEW